MNHFYLKWWFISGCFCKGWFIACWMDLLNNWVDCYDLNLFLWYILPVTSYFGGHLMSFCCFLAWMLISRRSQKTKRCFLYLFLRKICWEGFLSLCNYHGICFTWLHEGAIFSYTTWFWLAVLLHWNKTDFWFFGCGDWIDRLFFCIGIKLELTPLPQFYVILGYLWCLSVTSILVLFGVIVYWVTISCSHVQKTKLWGRKTICTILIWFQKVWFGFCW